MLLLPEERMIPGPPPADAAIVEDLVVADDVVVRSLLRVVAVVYVDSPSGVALDTAVSNYVVTARDVHPVGEICGAVIVDFEVNELVVVRNKAAIPGYQYATTRRVHYFLSS